MCKECNGETKPKRNKGYTFVEVKEYFKEQGCVLLSTEYKNNKQELEYICVCGEKSTIKFDKFKSGQRCRKCSYIKSANKRRHDYEFIKNEFEKGGCVLLSETYVDSSTPLDYICECGNVSKISYGHFKNGVRCKKCAGNQSFTIDELRNIYLKEGCVLLSDEYKNNKSKLEYICSCGNKHTSSFDVFQRGSRCPICKGNSIREKRAHSFEYVKSYFEENECELLEDEYINSNTLMKYKCSCGNESKIRFDDFRKGVRCQECRKILISETISGEKHYAYNPNLTEEDRIDRRIFPEYKQWRKEVYERDNYTCQCCGLQGENKLVAHHKDGYHWCEDKRTDVNNGVTLCEECHNDFHTIYGRKYNTKEQYSEFEMNYKNRMLINLIKVVG